MVSVRRFTLVELVVVIGILCVLASFLLAVVSRAFSMGRTAVCTNNLRQISLGILAHENENDGRVMQAEFRAPDGTYPLGSWLNVLYAEQLSQESNLFLCPSHSLSPDETFNPYGGDGVYGELKHASYIMNTIAGSGAVWSGTDIPIRARGYIGEDRSTPLHRSRIKNPAGSIYIVDRAPRRDHSACWNSGNNLASRGINRYSETDAGVPYPRPTTSCRKVNLLHQDGFVALFGDGHAELRRAAEPREWAVYIP